MESQTASVNRLLGNTVLAAGLFAIASVFAGTLWLLFTHKQVLDMKAEVAGMQATYQKTPSGPATEVIPPVQNNDSATATAPVEQPVKTDTMVAKVETSAEPKMAETVAVPVPEKKVVQQPKFVKSKDIVLAYYFRKADNESLQLALKTLGYNFDVRTLDKNTGYQKTNCIWFGAGVPLSDVKKVAIALIQSGNTVKGIKRFPLSKKNSSYKRNIIEVGMEINYENYYSKPLSIVEVERAKDFK